MGIAEALEWLINVYEAMLHDRSVPYDAEKLKQCRDALHRVRGCRDAHANAVMNGKKECT